MLNKVVVMGRLTKEPEMRYAGSNNTPVVSFSLACERDYKGSDGEKQTDFFECVAWRGTAEFISKYFSKGRMMVADGRLQYRKWEDKDGNKRSTVEVLVENAYFGDSKKETAERVADVPERPVQKVESRPDAGVSVKFEEDFDSDGELPF